jgi:hypothetical protein
MMTQAPTNNTQIRSERAHNIVFDGDHYGGLTN